MIEEWKVVPEFSKYEVSNTGLIRDIKNKQIKSLVWNNNFLCTNMYRDDGMKVLCKVHRMVALTFIENPTKVKKVKHKNEDRSDNTVGNLEWSLPPEKEVKPSSLKRIDYRGNMYTVKEFSDLCKATPETTRSRIKEGWSLDECVRGHKTFTQEGITTDTHWFPSKTQKEAHERSERKKFFLRKKELRKLQIEQWKNRRVCGVGIRDIELSSSDPIYKRWSSMITRCYSETMLIKYPSYEDKYVGEDWKYLSKFKAWMEVQNWEGLQLDKDILIKGNKEYRAEACAFVPGYVNSSLCLSDRGRGDYPVGVCYNKKDKTYFAKIKSMGKVTDLGYHPTPELAHAAWQKAKIVELENIINRYSFEPFFRTDVAEALMSRVWDLRNDILLGRETITL